MKRRSLVHVVCAVLVLSGLRAAAQQQEPPRFTGQGKILELGDGVVGMVDAAGKSYLVAFDRRSGCQVQVVGPADVSYLAPGMLVRFTADLNEKGVAEDPIKRLSVVEASEVVRPGLQAQVAIGEQVNRRGPQTYVVVGQIRSVRRGQLQVATPDGVVKAKLDPEAEIEVDVSDYWLARKDDTLEVEVGYLLAPPQEAQPGQVLAQKVIIELDPQNPLTAKAKKSRPTKKTKTKETEDSADEDKKADSTSKGDTADKNGKERNARTRRGKKADEQGSEKQDKDQTAKDVADKEQADKSDDGEQGARPAEQKAAGDPPADEEVNEGSP